MYFHHSHILLGFASWNADTVPIMPPHRYLRPVILPTAHHLPPIPHRLPCSPITHQHHHMRTTATLPPPYRSQRYAFSVGSAIAAMFGAVSWLRPQRSTNATNTAPSYGIRVLDAHSVERYFNSELRKAFHEYLGCHNIQIEPSRPIESDLHTGFFWDGDATSGAGKGSVMGVCLTSLGREEMEMVEFLQRLLEAWDKEGVLRRHGKAVCLLSCRGVDGIWVYGEEVENAEISVWGVEGGGCLSRIFSVGKLYLDLGNNCDRC